MLLINQRSAAFLSLESYSEFHKVYVLHGSSGFNLGKSDAQAIAGWLERTLSWGLKG
jgi:hypothetical protein